MFVGGAGVGIFATIVIGSVVVALMVLRKRRIDANKVNSFNFSKS
jgi:hypothetical protein